MTDITVILTVYNQSLESIERSIRSVAKQHGIVYQFVVADDHSAVDSTSQIEQLCLNYGIINPTIVRHSKNLQTIGNILHTKDYIHGRYVKVFGAGDELSTKTTLKEIVEFCDKYSVKVGFGNMRKESDGLRFHAPRNDDDYPPAGSASRKELFQHQADTADWIPGCAQFFEKTTLYALLEVLYTDFGLRYCEDFAALIALTDCDVYHLDKTVLLYEDGTGISTSNNLESREKLYRDHTLLYKNLREKRPFDSAYLLASTLFDVRRFIALKTPVYSFLQKLAMQSYSKNENA